MFNPRVLRVLFYSLMSLSVTTVTAQRSTNSHYTQYGIGDIQSAAFAHNSGFAGLSASISGGNNINVGNPASYSALNVTTFETAMFGNIEKFNSSATTETPALSNTGGFKYIALGFPIYKKINWGGSVGLLPYSRVGYRYISTEKISTGDEAQLMYKGDGGINRFYIGNGFSPVKGLSLGFNISYLFGNIEKVDSVTFGNVFAGHDLASTNQYYFGKLYFDFGAIYTQKLTEKYSISLGLNGSNKTNVPVTLDHSTTSRYIDVNNGIVREFNNPTTTSTEVKMVIPKFLSAGLSLKNANKWMIGADFSAQAWSDYSSFGKKDYLTNSSKLIVGGSYTLKRVQLRAGFRNEKSYYKINGQQINEQAISIGCGIPMSRGWSFVNISAEIAQRGSLSNNLILEQYGRLIVGLTLSDTWFQKRKFD